MKSYSSFVDNESVLCYGGRLDRVYIRNNQKHQILIDNYHVASLIIRDIHLKMDINNKKIRPFSNLYNLKSTITLMWLLGDISYKSY